MKVTQLLHASSNGSTVQRYLPNDHADDKAKTTNTSPIPGFDELEVDDGGGGGDDVTSGSSVDEAPVAFILTSGTFSRLISTGRMSCRELNKLKAQC
ncbi:hypothetical protein KUF71_012985 [Frankliniella fusca]|uniref:Uncharacterized protein n=1 Tax=Frankliniella fusca TaxID=407009 RepID=A0AAE1LUR8_9NEOP|nr:hypothetical protein KUF71_012985 [Frankliniella fusca]